MKSVRALLSPTVLWIGAGLVLAAVGGSDTAAAEPISTAAPLPVVIRGSDPGEAGPAQSEEGSPIVLRGSPPSLEPAYAPPPAAEEACPPGAFYDPNYGCTYPETAYAPYGYWYWPYAADWYWPYSVAEFFPFRARRHAFHHAFFHRPRPLPAPRAGFRPGVGFRRGVGHVGGFGRGFGQAGGFGHR
jgi:hypothetical protein